MRSGNVGFNVKRNVLKRLVLLIKGGRPVMLRPHVFKPGPLFLNKRTSRQAPLFLDYYWLVMVIKGIFSGLGGVTG